MASLAVLPDRKITWNNSDNNGMKKIYFGIAIAAIILDQITKITANTQLEIHEQNPVMPFFNFTLMYNHGAAFSFLSDAGGWQR